MYTISGSPGLRISALIDEAVSGETIRRSFTNSQRTTNELESTVIFFSLYGHGHGGHLGNGI